MSGVHCAANATPCFPLRKLILITSPSLLLSKTKYWHLNRYEHIAVPKKYEQNLTLESDHTC
uniref:Uncharacterized protein n=2 Tax=Oryza TaxID=4527 RepID=A0A0E0PWV9_ORYRU